MLLRGFAVRRRVRQQLWRREFVGQLFVARFDLCKFVEHYDNGANSGSPVCGSNFKLSFKASSATSNCESSCSFVVTFCNQTPGRVIILKNAPLSFLADKRMISYESPATTGIRTMRTRKLKSRESNLITENKRIETSITTIRKLVPQRGCWRGCGRAFATVSSRPFSQVKLVLCSAP